MRISQNTIVLSDESGDDSNDSSDDVVVVGPPKQNNNNIMTAAEDSGVTVGGRTLRNRENIKPPKALEEYEPDPFRRRSTGNMKQKNKKDKSRSKKEEAKSKRHSTKWDDLPKRSSYGRSAKDQTEGHMKDWSGSGESDSEDYVDYDPDEEKERTKTRKIAAPKAYKAAPKDDSRAAVRADITGETTKKRNTFLLAKRHLFDPLLGSRNYVAKLADGPDGKKDQAELDSEIVPYKALTEQPKEVNAVMKPYQISGLSFLIYLHNNGLSGILGDEMGLGKTLQTLSLFSYITTNFPSKAGHPHRPFLVICPLSVLTSWVNETKKFTPHLKAMRLHGPPRERNRLKTMAEKGLVLSKDGSEGPVHPEDPDRGYDIIVSSYETFVAEKVWFRRVFMWRYVVLDEGHTIKNADTIISSTLHSIGAEHRLILTGTPLQNNLFELWSLFHWLYPEVFAENTADLWRDAFNLTKGKVNTDFLTDSRKLLEAIMLRRMKSSPSVNLGLPEKEEVLLYVPLSPVQRAWYKSILTKLDEKTLQEIFTNSKGKEESDLKFEIEDGKKLLDVPTSINNETKEDESADQWKEMENTVQKSIQQAKDEPMWRKLMNMIMQLRKVCNHPYLIPHAEPVPFINGQHVILASSKFILLEKMVKELVLKQGRKMLIFSGFTKMLDICEDFLQLVGGSGEKFRYCRLDGSTSRGRRNLSIRLFNNMESEYKVFLISTKAGGLGINLTSATEVVMLDASWNPQVDLQAEARSHRIGQTKKVTVYRLITQGTVEEQMLGRLRKKLYLSAKVTESMRDVYNGGDQEEKEALPADEEDAPKMTTNQLMSLVRRGAQAIARPEMDPKELISWDWETMFQKCRDYEESSFENKEAAATDKAASAEDAEKEWLNTVERVECSVFEGKKHQKEQAKQAKMMELDRSDRRAGKNRTVLIDGYEILKETVGNRQWEAVATIGDKDPRYREPPKRKKATITNQEYCQTCMDGGDIVLCSGCPRSYHYSCLDPQDKAMSKRGTFYCSQHRCYDCEQKAGDVGNLIFRCRWCEKGYCEDCLDFDAIVLLGDQILEYELLDHRPTTNATYIKCAECINLHEIDEANKKMCDDMVTDWENEMAAIIASEAKAEEEESLTDATTIGGTSGAITPAIDGKDSIVIIDNDDDDDEDAKKPSLKSAKSESDIVGKLKSLKQGTLASFFGTTATAPPTPAAKVKASKTPQTLARPTVKKRKSSMLVEQHVKDHDAGDDHHDEFVDAMEGKPGSPLPTIIITPNSKRVKLDDDVL